MLDHTFSISVLLQSILR